MRDQRSVYALLLIANMIAGCRHEPINTHIDTSYRYLPLNIGAWIEYDVDSIALNDFTQQSDTFSFVLRETIVDTFNDASGQLNYVIERSKYIADTLANEPLRFCAISRSTKRAEKTENNQRVVMLVFPPVVGEQWQGYAYNPGLEQEFEYDFVDQPFATNAHQWDSALKVIQLNDTANFLIKKYAEECYARGTGRVFRKYSEIHKKLNADSGLIWIESFRSSGSGN